MSNRRTKQRPGIIVLSEDGDEQFDWMSDGWNRVKVAGTPRARRLMAKARKCIEAADDVLDAIKRLEKAGFDVRRAGKGEAEWMEREEAR